MAKKKQQNPNKRTERYLQAVDCIAPTSQANLEANLYNRNSLNSASLKQTSSIKNTTTNSEPQTMPETLNINHNRTREHYYESCTSQDSCLSDYTYCKYKPHKKRNDKKMKQYMTKLYNCLKKRHCSKKYSRPSRTSRCYRNSRGRRNCYRKKSCSGGRCCVDCYHRNCKDKACCGNNYSGNINYGNVCECCDLCVCDSKCCDGGCEFCDGGCECCNSGFDCCSSGCDCCNCGCNSCNCGCNGCNCCCNGCNCCCNGCNCCCNGCDCCNCCDCCDFCDFCDCCNCCDCCCNCCNNPCGNMFDMLGCACCGKRDGKKTKFMKCGPCISLTKKKKSKKEESGSDSEDIYFLNYGCCCCSSSEESGKNKREEKKEEKKEKSKGKEDKEKSQSTTKSGKSKETSDGKSNTHSSKKPQGTTKSKSAKIKNTKGNTTRSNNSKNRDEKIEDTKDEDSKDNFLNSDEYVRVDGEKRSGNGQEHELGNESSSLQSDGLVEDAEEKTSSLLIKNKKHDVVKKMILKKLIDGNDKNTKLNKEVRKVEESFEDIQAMKDFIKNIERIKTKQEISPLNLQNSELTLNHQNKLKRMNKNSKSLFGAKKIILKGTIKEKPVKKSVFVFKKDKKNKTDLTKDFLQKNMLEIMQDIAQNRA